MTLIDPYRLAEQQMTDDQIRDRLFLPMLLESLLVSG